MWRLTSDDFLPNKPSPPTVQASPRSAPSLQVLAALRPHGLSHRKPLLGPHSQRQPPPPPTWLPANLDLASLCPPMGGFPRTLPGLQPARSWGTALLPKQAAAPTSADRPAPGSHSWRESFPHLTRQNPVLTKVPVEEPGPRPVSAFRTARNRRNSVMSSRGVWPRRVQLPGNTSVMAPVRGCALQSRSPPADPTCDTHGQVQGPANDQWPPQCVMN